MKNPMSLEGKTILITGASSGIGRATAILASELGARVILVARTESKLEETLTLMKGDGHLVAPFDLSNVSGINVWMKDIVAQTGQLSGLVHSAGNNFWIPLRFITDENYADITTIHLHAGINLARGLRQRGVYNPTGTSLVYLSSIAGIIGRPGLSLYSAAKGGLQAFARSVALELAEVKIRVNCIAPGLLSDTEMSDQARSTLTVEQFQKIVDSHPLGLGVSRDVANAIIFLLADTGRWITGTTLIVDGGYTA